MTMRFETRELGAVRREIDIEIDSAEVEKELERVVGEVTRNARIPGFRHGKVPRSLVRRRYGREIENEVLEHLVPRALGEALGKTGLAPVHRPVVKDVSLAEGQPLRFTASFEVKPKLAVEDYRGVAIEVPRAQVDDEDVERELQAMRERSAEYEAEEPRPLGRGDFALVDLGSGEGEDEREQANALIEVGSSDYHPEFARALEGLRPGEEKSFAVTYAEDDPDPRARGKSVPYRVRVKEVKRKVLPVLDDEFAKDTGRFESLAELRASLRRELEAQLERNLRRHQERQLAEAILAGRSDEVPQALVEVELDRMLEEQARLLALRGVDPRTAPVDWRATRERLRGAAERKVRFELVLEAIADKEAIRATPEDVEERLRRVAEGTQRSVEYVRSKIEKDGRMEELTRSARLERAIDFLLRNARMERR